MGVVQGTTTSAYTITRGVNEDGTIASEKRQSGSQDWEEWFYEYDALGRVTKSRLYLRAPTVTTYDNVSGRSVVVSGDGAPTTQTLDGLGRVIRTATATGVTVDVAYDGWGRRTVESAPHECNASRWNTATSYDVLDRVTEIVRPGGSRVTYAYDGLTVTIAGTVEDGSAERHITSQRWAASGSPAQARLLGVNDAEGHWATYAYDALGALTTGRGRSA